MFLIFSTLLSCMLPFVEYASRVDIQRDWEMQISRKESSRRLRRFLRTVGRDNHIDPRILALAWIESRLRINVERGDRGRACGVFQIHARYSHPLLRRSQGFRGWVEEDESEVIEEECSKLEDHRYSVGTVRRLLSMMDERELHPCHHNSGWVGTCNSWYRERLNFWISFFTSAQFYCNYLEEMSDANEENRGSGSNRTDSDGSGIP